MTYIAQQDIEDELGPDKLIQLTDSNDAGEVDSAVVEKAISYAEGVMNAYARTRYPIPLPATEMVKALCLDLAIFKLFRGRATIAEDVYKIRRDSFDDAVKLLKALQKGEAALDVPAAEETMTNPASPDRVLRGNSKPVFGDDKLSSF
jgi:phage gp36-like protein